MAQLKDLIVNGASRLIGDVYTNKLQITSISAPTSSGGTAYDLGTDGDILKSNGSSIYWSNISKSDIGLGNVTNDAQIPKSIGTAAGDIIYWSAANTPVRLGKGSNGQVLKLVSGVPAWSSDSNSDTLVKQTAKTDNVEYKVLLGANSSPTSGTAYEAAYDTGITINPSTDTLTCAKLKGYVMAGQKSGTTLGTYATAEGTTTTASGNYAHAEGNTTTASGQSSHAEGQSTTASETSTHAEGSGTTASAKYAHAEGNNSTASGQSAHAEGLSTTASGYYSHAAGSNTTAQRMSQYVFGEYNILDTTGSTTTKGNYIEIVGNGTSTTRSNARTLDWSGNESLAGNLLPMVNISKEIGSSSLRWKTGYIGAFTIGGGESDSIGSKTILSNSTFYLDRASDCSIIFKHNNVNKIWIDTSNSLRPATNNTLTIGTSSYKWENIFIRAYNNLITGTGTAAKDNGSGSSNRYQPAKWTFDTGSNATNGDIFTIKIPVVGHSYGVFMSVNNGTNYYPVVCGNDTTGRFTTHYPVGQIIQVIFDSTGSCASIYPLAGGTSTGTVSGGVFRVINYRDTNDNTCQRTYRRSTNVELPIAGITTTTSATAAYSAISSGSYKDVYAAIPETVANLATLNPSTGMITVPGGIKANKYIANSANAYGATLPSSGTTGQIFFQTTNDYYEIPAGGTTGQALVKNSATDRDVTWKTVHTIVNNTSVATSAWSQTNTYNDYPWRATIAISGLTSSYYAEVIFGLVDATSGTFAPIAETTSGGIYIYAKEQPGNAITIPTIIYYI